MINMQKKNYNIQVNYIKQHSTHKYNEINVIQLVMNWRWQTLPQQATNKIISYLNRKIVEK